MYCISSGELGYRQIIFHVNKAVRMKNVKWEQNEYNNHINNHRSYCKKNEPFLCSVESHN